MGRKSINTRAKGNRLELYVKKEVDEYLALHKKKYPILFYPGIKASSSRGYADVTFIVFRTDNGTYYPFGIQCKAGYVSPKTQKEGIKRARKEYGLTLFYAVGSPTKKVEYYPDIWRYIDKEVLDK